MMTFSTFHKIFINVITNNFHRSSKLILLSAFIYAGQHGSISSESETSLSCISLCMDRRVWFLVDHRGFFDQASVSSISIVQHFLFIRCWSPVFRSHFWEICSFSSNKMRDCLIPGGAPCGPFFKVRLESTHIECSSIG